MAEKEPHGKLMPPIDQSIISKSNQDRVTIPNVFLPFLHNILWGKNPVGSYLKLSKKKKKTL